MYDTNLVLGGKEFSSRLIVGTGKYKDYALNAAAARAAGAEIVTVALRRVNLSDPNQPMLSDFVKPEEFTYLPNTAGCFTGEEAVRTLRLAREAGGWSLVAPRATLYGDNGKVVATHYGGPTWEARDGSRVIGRRVAGVTVDPTAIPWLKLEAASAAAGDDGDKLAGVTFVQRYNTTGGLAPAAGTCGAANAGAMQEIPYTADYAFWRKSGA